MCGIVCSMFIQHQFCEKLNTFCLVFGLCMYDYKISTYQLIPLLSSVVIIDSKRSLICNYSFTCLKKCVLSRISSTKRRRKKPLSAQCFYTITQIFSCDSSFEWLCSVVLSSILAWPMTMLRIIIE